MSLAVGGDWQAEAARDLSWDEWQLRARNLFPPKQGDRKNKKKLPGAYQITCDSEQEGQDLEEKMGESGGKVGHWL